jgi:hypothetical protein
LDNKFNISSKCKIFNLNIIICHPIMVISHNLQSYNSINKCNITNQISSKPLATRTRILTKIHCLISSLLQPARVLFINNRKILCIYKNWTIIQKKS